MTRRPEQFSLNLRPGNLRSRVPDARTARDFIDGGGAQALETGRTRLLVAGMVFALAFTVIAWRLVDIAAFSPGGEPRIAATPPAPAFETGRADIVDRNGVVLATSLPTASLYANPRQLRDPAGAAARLVGALPGLSQTEIRAKLSTDRSFIWLKRNLTPREQYRVNRLGIPGLYFEREERRFYPHGRLTAHGVGFTNVDNKGLAGVERSFDEVLRGRAEPLALSLDLRVQYVLAQELAAAMTEFAAIGAAGLVMDAATGEVLALVSLPDFDPNRPGAAPPEARFNRASLGLYEMGSVFKIFTLAMALDEGVVTLDDGYDASKPIRIARFTINDFHAKNRWLSVPEIFMYSSNIGAARMAMDTGTAVQQAFLGRLGLTRPADIELAEVGRPLVPSPWREINTVTIAYGHGLAVSAVQMASAVAAVVNGGEFRPATLIKRAEGGRPPGTRIMSPDTSLKMRRLLRLVVRRGTGRQADAEGYRVGGKIGTADKLIGGRYARDARIASFAAAFPMNDPRYVIFVMVDEPKGTARTRGYATGGWVAAPIVRRVVERIGPILGVEPVRNDADQDGGEDLLVRAKARAPKVATN
ncbi:MAG: penicillin-binding protein 2 [Proteobacteria bacterium]|nr:penicillin-binding protein 2 [Pseudomonadota bacterium]